MAIVLVFVCLYRTDRWGFFLSTPIFRSCHCSIWAAYILFCLLMRWNRINGCTFTSVTLFIKKIISLCIEEFFGMHQMTHWIGTLGKKSTQIITKTKKTEIYLKTYYESQPKWQFQWVLKCPDPPFNNKESRWKVESTPNVYILSSESMSWQESILAISPAMASLLLLYAILAFYLITWEQKF